MKDAQYLQYIHNLIDENLNNLYKTIPSETELNKEIKNTINTLLAYPPLITNMANYLKNWSYMKSNSQDPNIALFVLDKEVIKQYTKQYVNWLNQTKYQNNVRIR